MEISENAGKVQRLDGHSSQEEYNLVATVGETIAEKITKAIKGLQQKNDV